MTGRWNKRRIKYLYFDNVRDHIGVLRAFSTVMHEAPPGVHMWGDVEKYKNVDTYEGRYDKDIFDRVPIRKRDTDTVDKDGRKDYPHSSDVHR